MQACNRAGSGKKKATNRAARDERRVNDNDRSVE